MPDILTYKCPFCGGGVEFDASAQKMQCPFCDSVFDMETIQELEKATLELGSTVSEKPISEEMMSPEEGSSEAAPAPREPKRV